MNSDPSDGLNGSVTLDTYLTEDSVTEKSEQPGNYIKISEVLNFLVKYLLKLLPLNSQSDSLTKMIYIKSLIQCELFLPITYSYDIYGK